MTITQHLPTYNFHTSNFNFGEIYFLKFLSIQPLLTTLAVQKHYPDFDETQKDHIKNNVKELDQQN